MCTQRKGSCVHVRMVYLHECVHKGRRRADLWAQVFVHIQRRKGSWVCEHERMLDVCTHEYVLVEEKGSLGYAHEHIRVGCVCMCTRRGGRASV